MSPCTHGRTAATFRERRTGRFDCSSGCERRQRKATSAAGKSVGGSFRAGTGHTWPPPQAGRAACRQSRRACRRVTGPPRAQRTFPWPGRKMTRGLRGLRLRSARHAAAAWTLDGTHAKQLRPCSRPNRTMRRPAARSRRPVQPGDAGEPRPGHQPRPLSPREPEPRAVRA